MIKINQVDYSQVQNKNFDFFIAASGFEKRASFQSQEFRGIAHNKIVLGFNSVIDHPNRKVNDSVFNKNDFETILIDSEISDNIKLKEIIDRIYEMSKKKAEVKIYIDYSSMTQNWYSYLLFLINNLIKNISITFGYSHAKYIPSNGKNILNRVVKPLLGYCNLSVPSKPTALIIGMGNEPNRIYGLKEYFDAVPYLFYSDNSYNEEYSTEIEFLNKDFINEIKTENVFRFPIYDLIYTNYLLDNLCNVLMKNFRVIIAPCGPKPFALLAMLNSLMHDNLIEVWRISPGDSLSICDRVPTGLISTLEVNFS